MRRKYATPATEIKELARSSTQRSTVASRMHACMQAGVEQMTWRAPADLIERVRRAAQRQRRSMNDYVTAVLDAATNPRLAGGERLRERLDQAGLLADSGQHRGRPPRDEATRARSRAGRGTALSEIVSEDR